MEMHFLPRLGPDLTCVGRYIKTAFGPSSRRLIAHVFLQCIIIGCIYSLFELLCEYVIFSYAGFPKK